MSITYPEQILQGGVEIGLVLAPHTESSRRVRPISIDPQVLVEVQDDQNPNFMSDEDFRGLCRAVEHHDFGQPVTVFEDQGTWRLIDGVHRKRAAVLCGLGRIPALQYVELRPGEDKALRVYLNRWRGAIRQDVEQGILRELLNQYGWSPEELSPSGYSPAELESLRGLEAAPLSIPSDQGGLDQPGPEVEPEPARKAAAILEVAFSSESDFRLVKRAIQRAAKAAGVTKGARKLEVGLVQLVRRAEGED